MLKINMIGCGKLGKTIAKLIAETKTGQIVGVVNTNINSANAAIRFIGQGQAYSSIKELPAADMYMITTNDAVIEKVCLELIETNQLKAGTIVAHCSGSLSSRVLLSAKKHHCHIASIHPIKSFANPETCIKQFKDTFCVFEGDENAFATIKQLMEGIGGKMMTVNSNNKAQYHAALVMANNYLVTLHFHASQNLISAGIDPSIAKLLISTMMTDALNHLTSFDHTKALTGPIQRGDIETVKSHMDALTDTYSRHIYATLGNASIPLTTHAEQVKKKLEEVLR